MTVWLIAAAATAPRAGLAQESPQSQIRRHPVQSSMCAQGSQTSDALRAAQGARRAREAAATSEPIPVAANAHAEARRLRRRGGCMVRKATVTVCYEYLDDVWRNAPRNRRDRGSLRSMRWWDRSTMSSARKRSRLVRPAASAASRRRRRRRRSGLGLHHAATRQGGSARLILGTAYAYSVEFKPSIVPYVFIGLGSC